MFDELCIPFEPACYGAPADLRRLF